MHDPVSDPWGGAFRALWRAAHPAGRRRAAFLAVGLPRASRVSAPGLRRPLRPPPTPEAWAAGVRDDGAVDDSVGGTRGTAGGPSAPA